MTDKEKSVHIGQIRHEIAFDNYKNNPKQCKHCNEIINYEQRVNNFCSRSCACSFNNLTRGFSWNNKHGAYKKKQCLVCQKETTNPKYCSRECQGIGSTNQLFKRITESGTADGSNAATTKKYLLETRDRKCEMCGITEWQGKEVPLVLDHIDGKPQNNVLDNLRLVCGNCNMQLPTFAGRNVGKGGGRPYRNSRYLEGKSW